MNDQNVELWEDSSGGLMLVADGKGFKGLERLWLLYVSQPEHITFEEDAARFETIAEGGLYEPMTLEEIYRLYASESEPGGSVNVASCERGYVDVWEAPKGGAATWYLGEYANAPLRQA